MADQTLVEGDALAMRITFITHGYPWKPLGALRVVYEYANRLAARDHRVAIVHPRYLRDELGFWAPRGLYGRLRRQGARLRNLALKPRVRWQAVDPRVRMLFVPKPTAAFVPDGDAVIAGVWGTAPSVLACPKQKGEKFQLLQIYAVSIGQPKWWVDAIWRAPLHSIAVSGWLGDIGRQLGAHDIEVVPNAINASLFSLKRPTDQRHKRVAMMFSLKDWKGSADGMKALAIAKRKHPDLRAVFFGVYPKWANIPDWIESRGCVPHEELVQDVYNASRVFLCPSWEEGFSLPPLEAMACGCAVVTTDNGGNRDYAEHERNALVSPPRKPERLAENLLRVLDDDALRLRLAQAGIARSREFTWERSTDKLESVLYRRVLDASREAPVAATASLAEGKPNRAEF